MNTRLRFALRHSIILATVVATWTPTIALAQAYKCQINGKTAYQDTPCDGASKPLVQALVNEQAALRRRVAACEQDTSQTCERAREALRFWDSTADKAREANDLIKNLELRAKSIATDARLAHRIAREDYDRADAALNNRPGDRFSALLAQRSEASDRMRAASKKHYDITKQWLD